MTTLDKVKQLQLQISKSIIGQDKLITKIVIALLADGNLLLEGLPGLAKTRAIKSLAKEIDVDMSRIQFTPDLLPSDITGSELYQPEEETKFMFQPGPIFSNLILADEINRAPAKVQAALLEAMEERQVSAAGKTYKMDPLFMVLATQNPVEQEGTYPLPEAQTDRFIMKVIVDYPTLEDEIKILQLVRSETKGEQGKDKQTPLDSSVIFDAREEINRVTVSDAAENYIANLIFATRYPEKYSKKLSSWIEFGASPRGTISLDKAARVAAWLDGRDYVTPDDIRSIIFDVLRHRIALSYSASAEGITSEIVIDEILKVVTVL